mmetsp:Transcript_15882/g.42850  ORF Transcript_15882/g.42850 Transcript_15882/m.42850 type:complete len:121 (+) Transcript_15882:150-512(+)
MTWRAAASRMRPWVRDPTGSETGERETCLDYACAHGAPGYSNFKHVRVFAVHMATAGKHRSAVVFLVCSDLEAIGSDVDPCLQGRRARVQRGASACRHIERAPGAIFSTAQDLGLAICKL